MLRRRSPDAPQGTIRVTDLLPAPAGRAVLAANNWVAEKMGEDGLATVLPLVGWMVTDEGELRPLPLSLDASWTIRPRCVDDDRLISVTASRMRPTSDRQSEWNFYR